MLSSQLIIGWIITDFANLRPSICSTRRSTAVQPAISGARRTLVKSGFKIPTWFIIKPDYRNIGRYSQTPLRYGLLGSHRHNWPAYEYSSWPNVKYLRL